MTAMTSRRLASSLGGRFLKGSVSTASKYFDSSINTSQNASAMSLICGHTHCRNQRHNYHSSPTIDAKIPFPPISSKKSSVPANSSPLSTMAVEMHENDAVSPSLIVSNLLDRLERNALFEQVEILPDGERAFHLDALPSVPYMQFQGNNVKTADWLYQTITSTPDVTLYVGFEAFYHPRFHHWMLSNSEDETSSRPRIIFSPLVKSCREYLLHRAHFDALECTELSEDTLIVHLGASHAFDHILFPDPHTDVLQKAWKEGQLVILSPQLSVADKYVFRASLEQILDKCMSTLMPNNGDMSFCPSYSPPPALDYSQIDKDIQRTKENVGQAKTYEEALAEVYRLVSNYVASGHLDSSCYFDAGWESFQLFKSVSSLLKEPPSGVQSIPGDATTMPTKIPWTRDALVNGRNAAIGDALHAFYAASPKTFPIVVTGDTAALLAGGISLINIYAQQRFGSIILLNNQGMAIEDAISKRSVEGHSFNYNYVKLHKKKDIFKLDELKMALQNNVLTSLRDHLWGINPKRSEATVLNIDIQSLRREAAATMASQTPSVPSSPSSDALLMGESFLSSDFGDRYAMLAVPRSNLERIVNVLYEEQQRHQPNSPQSRVKIQGCSAIEFMELLSQLTMTSRSKLEFLPTPTDLLATRTLLSGLVSHNDSLNYENQINSNSNFSVLISNAVFGTDGLNNLISTHLEYGTGTLIHLAYDAAKTVTQYNRIGQIHRQFGIRPAIILPSLYRNHQGYENQVLHCSLSSNDDTAALIRQGLRDNSVKVILVDCGAPALTGSI